MDNKTFYTVECDADEDSFATYAEAEDAAKRRSSQYRNSEYFVLKAVSKIESPVPEGVVTQLS